MLVFECCYFACVCVCVCYSLTVCVTHCMFILFSECRNSRNIVVSWKFMLFSECLCYCHVLLLPFKRFYSLHICVFLGMIILFAECWYSPSVAAALWMSVFCEYLCYALKFVLPCESFVDLWMSLLLSFRVLKAYIISKSDFFASRMSVLTYVADKDECYSIVNSEVWGSNPVPVYSSWWRFHKT